VEDRKTAVTTATDVVELSKGPPRGSVIAGKYRVESTLGFGGMGIVLAAHHLQLDEPVAIKILRDDVRLEPEHVERFIREAQAAVRLKSENVARIDDVGMLPDGKPYMVMELLEGLDLGRLLQDAGHIAPQLAVDFVLQVCDALAEAHALGIVHRDIKPTNLFVTSRRDGTPLIKVLDFGISKAAASASDLSLTQTSSMLGTPAYMSPEQMRNARTADARSDIWSLGTVLYELVEGTTPFIADSFAELCIAVATENPQDMKNAPELQPVLARSLTKTPDDRYPSIAELADDLAPFSSDPQRANRQVNRIFRLLGKQPPHPGARDSTPAIVRIRDSASMLDRGRDSGAQLRAQTFAGEEASTVANAGPTIFAARRRPLGLVIAGLALLAVGAAAGVIVLTGQHEAAPQSDAASVTPGANVASSAPAAAIDPGSAAGSAPGSIVGSAPGSIVGSAPGSAVSSAAGSAIDSRAGSALATGSAAGSARSSDHASPPIDVATGSAASSATLRHTPAGAPPHRIPASSPPVHRVPSRHSPPPAGSDAPAKVEPQPPKCDPFANAKGCPKTP